MRLLAFIRIFICVSGLFVALFQCYCRTIFINENCVAIEIYLFGLEPVLYNKQEIFTQYLTPLFSNTLPKLRWEFK